MEDEGLDVSRFLAQPEMTPALRRVIKRLLREAEGLYVRSEAGVAALPIRARPGIFAARYIYAGIGGQLKRLDLDSIAHRAKTTGAQKTGWLILSLARAGGTLLLPRSAVIHARPLPETAFLVEAASDLTHRMPDWSDALYSTMATLRARDQVQTQLRTTRSRAVGGA